MKITNSKICIKSKTIIMLATVLMPVSSFAQWSQMEDLLVTGSYSPQQNADLTASVSVLDSQTIQALNKRTIADLLKNVPGLLVEEQGGPGGLTAISIRGGEANFTLVLLDGVPLNDPTNSRGGGFDFSNLDPASIERIEIVRGTQSAVYGSDALSGVINIITHRGQEGHQQQLRAEVGEDDIRNFSLAASGESGVLRYALNLSKRDEGEQIEGSTRETDNASLRLDWQASDKHQISASYRYLDGQRNSYPEQSGGPELALSNLLDDSDYEDQTFYLNWQANISDNWQSVVSAKYFEHEESFNSPGVTPFTVVPPNAADTHFQRYQLQWLNTLQISDAHQLSLGVDYRNEEGDSRGFLDLGFFKVPTNFELERSTHGLFVDFHSRPIQALLFQASLRYDDPDNFDSETSINLGVSYQINPLLTVSANWGEAYKLPSFFALGHSLVGNPNLKPETARAWDVGLKWSPRKDVDLAVSYFSNDYRDLIDFDPALFINVNRSRVESHGTELQLSWKPLQEVWLQAQTTHIDLNVKNGTSVLLGRPEWKAGAMALWQINRDWSTTLDYQWMGEQFASSMHTGASMVQTLSDFHRVDWNVRKQFGKAVHLELALDNLLDENFRTAVGFPGPGRTARFSICFKNVFI
ncbi:MAG: TonB-dependent receptor [Proteobacteria bacterium]|nr:TonB-dependent receptor [Pseudomonadota bacterium]